MLNHVTESWRAVAVFSAVLSYSAIALPEESVMSDLDTQSNWSAEQRTVWAVVVDWNKAFARNEGDAFFEHVHDDITLISPANPYRVEGIRDDREAYDFELASGRSTVNFFQMMQPLVRVYGEMAVVTYFSRGYYGPDGGAIGYFKETDVLMIEDGQWKIIHIHLSE